jgi:LuxR family transcriptional regulator, positive regulator of biofilm formation
MPEKMVHLVGGNALQNELFVSYLEKETGMTITNSIALSEAPIAKDVSDLNHLVLFDTMGINVDDIWAKIGIGADLNPGRMLIALFNVDKGKKLEKEAIGQGIRGIFYENEKLDIFARGVQSIFDGEMWYSRKIVSQCLLASRTIFQASPNTATLLTGREKETLLEMATGASNQEIADTFFISQHTVKTHIYNIYKKINVSNRLQAILWAVKYLSNIESYQLAK